MIEVSVKRNDLGKMQKTFKKKFRLASASGLDNAGKHVAEKIQQLINDPPKSGIKYPSFPNRSSAVGEAPANQTGTLKNSVKHTVRSWNRMEVGDTVKYGLFLEINHRRPHISTAVGQTMETVKMMLSIAIREGLK